MASLADANPPIALGALDGRYRGTVAPLVDHLSEAALNRQRVHVEIEWLIHQTSHGVVPGVRHLTDDEIAALRAVVDDFGTDEVAELAEIERVTVHDVKAVEYFLKERLTAIAPAERGQGPRRAHPLRVHERGHQQPLLRPHGQGRRRAGVAAPGPGARGAGGRAGARAQGRAAARAHPRPAGDADDDGQGARRPRAPPRPAAAPHRAPGVPRQVQRRDRHLRRARPRPARRRLAGRLARLRRGPRPDVEPADDPDREPRLAGRALCRRRPLQPHPAQPLHRRVDLHLDGLLRAGARPGHRGFEHDAAQGQPDPLRERRGQPRGEQRPARRARAARSCRAGCSATSPTRACSATSAAPSATPCSPSTTSPGASPVSTPCPSGWPPTSRPTGRCSASRSSRRCARWARRASPAWRSPTSGSRS